MPVPMTPIGYEVRRDATTRDNVDAPHKVSAAIANVRPPLPIAHQQAPDPPRQGDTPSRIARWPKAIMLNIPDILSVQEDEFGYLLWAPVHLAATPIAGSGMEMQHPWVERTNLPTPEYIAYGSQYDDDPYILLTGGS